MTGDATSGSGAAGERGGRGVPPGRRTSDNGSTRPSRRGGSDSRRRTGQLGEDHAAELMEARGGVVISRNWWCRAGELDLVVLDSAGRLRFVEVRTRSGRGYGTPAESVTADKRRRLRRLAGQWLSENPGRWGQVCFDVVGVDLSDSARPRLELFEDVM